MSLISRKDYRRVNLIRLTYENCDQDAFLQPFFTYIDSLFFGCTSAFARGVFAFDSKNPTIGAEKLLSFVRYLCINFYSKIMGRPKVMSWESPGQLSSSATPETRREAQLRKDCLSHDHHRCVVSRKFGLLTAMKRLRESGVKDDDGKRVFSNDCMEVDVVHIIPLSVIEAKDNKELGQSQRLAILIFDMFDPKISLTIRGSDIDKPRNAMCLMCAPRMV